MLYGSPLPITAFDDPAMVGDYAAALESGGFDFTSIAGHVMAQPPGVNPQRPDRQYAGPFYDPFVTFAWLAARTQRLRFMSAILILPSWPTVLVARQAAELALFSGGRFLDRQREAREGGQIRRHACAHTLRQREFPHVNGIANIKMRDIDRDHIGKIARQTFDLERAERLLEQAAKCFHPFRRADRLERHLGLDHFIHRNRVEIDVQNIAANRGMLHFLNEREAAGFLTIDLQLDQDVFPRSMTEDERNVALRHLQRFGLILSAVDDRRDRALRFYFTNRRSAESGAPGCRQFYLCSHDV